MGVLWDLRHAWLQTKESMTGAISFIFTYIVCVNEDYDQSNFLRSSLVAEMPRFNQDVVFEHSGLTGHATEDNPLGPVTIPA